MVAQTARPNAGSPAVKSGTKPCLLNSSERIVRALHTLSAGNRAVLRATDECQLLHDMCNVAVAVGGYRGAGVVYANEDISKSLQWMDWSGMDRGQVVFIDVSVINRAGFTWANTPLGQTAVGVAIRTRAPCIGRDLLLNPIYDMPEYSSLKLHAVKSGFASITAIPLLHENKVLGSMFIAAAESNAFDDDEMQLLIELADDLAFGICALRTQAKHRQALLTIERLAFWDADTGLPNRTRLLQVLEAAMEIGGAEHLPVAMLYLKVERFQDVHQLLGYRASNLLMKQIGERVAQILHHGMTLARIGDDSFGIVAPGLDRDDATMFANGLVLALDDSIKVNGIPVHILTRAGVAVFAATTDESLEPEALVRHATAALQQRASGYVRVMTYTGEHETESTCQLGLMGDFRHAIAHNELLLYCQPKVDIRSGRVLGAEALVRWMHPERGMIFPDQFIKLAEKSGMMPSLTGWLMHASFGQVREWQRAQMDQTLAINLSVSDLHSPSLPSHIENLLSAWGLPSELVQFELTESALIDDPATALDALTRLKCLGVSILIDDFGTGYSSLSYLQKYPIDGIKIDQSFVIPMMRSQDSAVIVRSTIELGHNLGMEVIAEGVENQAVWDALAADGCDIAQGFLIGKPMPIQEFAHWTEAWTARRNDRHV